MLLSVHNESTEKKVTKKSIEKDHDYFNPDTYAVVDRVTGEEVDVKIFIEKVSRNGWQKAYAKTLAEYINCGDGKAVKFLAYIIKNKNPITNEILGTQRLFAKDVGVSLDVISKTMKLLQKKDLIKLIHSGRYMVSPDLMRNGNNKAGVIMFRRWGELD